MSLRKAGKSQKIAALKAGFSERSGRRIEKAGILPSQRPRRTWRTRPDPFVDVWESIVVPLLKKEPGLLPITLLEHLQTLYPGQYPNNKLRTLERRIKQWQALHGPPKEVMFRQQQVIGRLGLSDFTKLKGITITVQGQPLRHHLYHFRLAYSHWSYMEVVLGGESYLSVAKGLQNALWQLGGVPLEHRTDSLSAAFKNLSREDCRDLTRDYKELCAHYGLKPTRNNRGQAHENGSVESPHGHLKRRLKQALKLRGSCDFQSLKDYQLFVEQVVARHNQNQQAVIEEEKAILQPLPLYRYADFTIITARVTSSSTITVQRVLYTVPSQLIGYRLEVQVYDDHLACYLGREHVLDLPRLRPHKNKRHCINYRHVIHSLAHKPQAFRYSALREELLPTPGYQEIWQRLDQLCAARLACRIIVGLLKIAADYECEAKLEQYVLPLVRQGQVPCLGSIAKLYQPTADRALPATVQVQQHGLALYDCFLKQLPQGGLYA